MNYAVIQSGGKQHLVSEGGLVRVEKLTDAPGATIVFGEVLLVTADNEVMVGTPHVAKAKVEAEIVRHARAPKLFGAKVKSKKRYKKIFGHKQHFTEIKITKITAGRETRGKATAKS